ncbi:MAG: class I mannose-6-phosphate isomerase [Firmicutes bacterium]|nr:class I mannose-6-phosphate isomerase [Bacillota bacterium]
MKYITFKPNYDKFPSVRINENFEITHGIDMIVRHILSHHDKHIAIETYPGVDTSELIHAFENIDLKHDVINTSEYSIGYDAYKDFFEKEFTEDRVFGFKTSKSIQDLFNIPENLKYHNPTIIIGFGASLFPHDVLYYASIKRFEHQLRMRRAMPNYMMLNHDEDPLTKYKRSYFVEWVIADKNRVHLIDKIDYIIDWNDIINPKLINYQHYQKALRYFTKRPFRMVPYFDPGVWGGQWLKEVCQLDKSKENYAWSFDGVAEENSIIFKVHDIEFEFQAQELIYEFPLEVLGKHVFKHFKYHLPIRFDLLDTMEGQHLSLQVHPKSDYIKEVFGMPYTQDESYYILDAGDDSQVFLGFKENVDRNIFENELKASLKTKSFQAEKFINTFPVKKHDHLLIPAGTIHCSGRNTLVLEISSAAYIFTFKLWDWDRVGLDGKPRPVYHEHGLKNLEYSRSTNFVKANYINPFKVVNNYLEKSGIDHGTFLDAYRISIDQQLHYTFKKTVQMANLVEGKSMIVSSLDASFDDIIIHYAETFVIPANVENVKFSCMEEHCKIMYAEVKSEWSKQSY